MSWMAQAQEFVKGVRAESEKISWPTPTELRDSTIVVIVTVLLATGGFFTCGAIPAEVGALVLLFAIAGEVVLGLKAAALALLRPVAQVLEVPRFVRRLPR